MSRIVELCLELCDHAAEARRLLREFYAAQAAGGRGVHRDPVALLRELGEELVDIRDAAREAQDAVRPTPRGTGR
jgi:hypothetical protein